MGLKQTSKTYKKNPHTIHTSGCWTQCCETSRLSIFHSFTTSTHLVQRELSPGLSWTLVIVR